MKHGQGKELAERMYISDGLPFTEIARLIERSDKTVREWSAAGNWPGKRDAYLATRQNVHEKLYKVVDRLADKILNDCNSDEKLDPGTLYALAKIADKLAKMRAFESSVAADNKAAAPSDGVSEEAMRKIEQKLKLL